MRVPRLFELVSAREIVMLIKTFAAGFLTVALIAVAVPTLADDAVDAAVVDRLQTRNEPTAWGDQTEATDSSDTSSAVREMARKPFQMMPATPEQPSVPTLGSIGALVTPDLQADQHPDRLKPGAPD
jgi:hypothetical protein